MNAPPAPCERPSKCVILADACGPCVRAMEKDLIGNQARRSIFCDICQQTRPGNLIAETRICIDMNSRPVPKELGVAIQILKLCRDNARCINQAQQWAGKRPTMPKIGDVVDLVDYEGRRLPAIVMAVWPCRTAGRPPVLSLTSIDPDPLSHGDQGAPVVSFDQLPHASAVAKDGEDWEQLIDGLPGPFWVEPRDEMAQLRREVAQHTRAREQAEVRNEAGGKRLDDLATRIRNGGVPTGKRGGQHLADRIQEISDDLEGAGDEMPKPGLPLPTNITPIGKGREGGDGGA